MARKDELFSPATIQMMRDKSVRFILIQIDEAHSTAWPIGGIDQGVSGGGEGKTRIIEPSPQSSLEERVERAQRFVQQMVTSDLSEEGVVTRALKDGIITVLVDTWDNDFGNTCQAWPDVYYCVDATTMNIIAKSTYGERRDALIDVDCLDVLQSL